MTMMPIWKKCPKCHKTYDWNPDDGVTSCPYCGRREKNKQGIFEKILGSRGRINDNISFDEISVATENPILGKDGKPCNKEIRIDM